MKIDPLPAHAARSGGSQPASQASSSARCRLGRLVVTFLASVLWPGAADALDLHTVFDGECRHTSGLLLHVDPEGVSLVDLEGRRVRVPRAQISVLVLHKLLESPLAKVEVDPALAAHVRRVWVDADREPTFSGWAAAFYDDLVIFVDLEGRTHVLEPEDIRRIAPVSVSGTQRVPRPRPPPVFALPPELVPCSTEAPAPNAVPPSYVIADRIKLGDHFAQLEDHYRALDGFEERTRVYAGPYVFDAASRVGLLYFEDMPLPIPFYFRWSTGRAYRFQSLLMVGNAVNEWLPVTQPTLSLRSDVKSHFFSASFVGHLVALPAGTDAFIVEDAVEGLSRNLETNTTTAFNLSYNYLMLLGADYWRFSISGGPTYIAARVLVPGAERRTVQADQSSPTVRLRYQSDPLDARFLYFRTRMDGVRTTEVDRFVPGLPTEGERGQFELAADTFRIGLTLRPLAGLELMADEVITLGDYTESMLSEPVVMSFFHAETQGMVAADFGRYVTVKAYGRLLRRSYTVGSPAGEDARWETRFGGALEFVF